MRLKFLLFSLRKLYVAVFIGLSVGAVAQTVNASTPDTDHVPVRIFGTWEVTGVHIDAGATRTLLYQHDDPRLRGRIFNFTRDRFTSNTPEERACESPTIATRLRINGLIESSMAGRALPPAIPTSDDYHIQLPVNASAQARAVNAARRRDAGCVYAKTRMHSVKIAAR